MNRNSKSRILVMATLALALGLLAPACKTKSALDRALEERSRWSVQALDWTQTADHVVLLSTRVNGPSRGALTDLTVKIVLQDASGATIDEIWHTYDLTKLPQGGPKDITIRIPAGVLVEGLGVDRLLSPSETDRPHIVELAGL
jgi:hypothetical protein